MPGSLRSRPAHFERVAGNRACIVLAGTLGLLALSSSGASADPRDVVGCVWSPVDDVAVVQGVLERWGGTQRIPPFERNAWDLTVEGARASVTLRFARGELLLAWRLDESCAPTEIVVRASRGYAGPRPNEQGVRQLVSALAAITQARHVDSRVRHPGAWRPPAVVAMGVGAAVAFGLLMLVRRRFATGVPGSRARTVRLLGLGLAVALLPYEPARSLPAWLDANFLVLVGILPLVSFLWLSATGLFGYGSPRRSDWPAWLVFVLALAIREGYARHGIEEVEIYFFHGTFPNRHSVVQPLLQMFLQPLAADPYRFMMHVGGVLGALATLPLYLFVRQRTGHPAAAVGVSALFAVHSIIVQMAPTDGPYSLLLLCWFSGLALWTTEDVDAKGLFAGAILLGLAATCRAEGSLYLLASFLLVDPGTLVAAVRRHRGAAVLGACGVAGLVAIHVSLCFPFHLRRGEYLPPIGSFTAGDILRAGLWSTDFNDRFFVVLVLVGGLAGLVDKRLRVGLGAVLAGLVVVWPLSMTKDGGYWVLHRFVAVCALQTIAAGVGAAWLAGLVPRVGRTWVGAIPALATALYLFVEHRDEIRDPNAITDEFWMLRNQLAPGGEVKEGCSLLALGRTMDTDIHDFSQVLPGIVSRRCEREDCVGIAAQGGCLYYLRSLNCYFFDPVVPPECRERGRTPAGALWPCLDPRCAELEQALELEPVEERTVDLDAAFRSPEGRPLWPRVAEIGLYRVIGAKSPAALGEATRQ